MRATTPCSSGSQTASALCEHARRKEERCVGVNTFSTSVHYVHVTTNLEVYHIVEPKLGNQLSAVLQAAQCREIICTSSLHIVSHALLNVFYRRLECEARVADHIQQRYGMQQSRREVRSALAWSINFCVGGTAYASFSERFPKLRRQLLHTWPVCLTASSGAQVQTKSHRSHIGCSCTITTCSPKGMGCRCRTLVHHGR